ncbi:hypothetical protein [Paenibacillus sp. Marseille-Q4541]|uniref:hypothetical protein n=1 Tax=Paenibacillus sp. Marseille-Q4541 TaxID=2831522 RepID=UPI001BA9E767|nr:hypothetical protein [Paenibacillus sp. Marseille-Q4541]
MSFYKNLALSTLKKINDFNLNFKNSINERSVSVSEFKNKQNVYDPDDDTKALQSAIDKVKSDGGGVVLIPNRTLYINSPILIDSKNTSLKGVGHGSKLKAVVSMPYVLKYVGINKFGNRGGTVKDLLIDCDNLTTNGLIIGSDKGTVVGNKFTHIRIERSIEYGMVWDACQNNYFNLIDIEYCGGSLAMLNGAGNNVVMKSEFASASRTHHIYGGTSQALGGYGNNDFNNVPQANKFYGCVFERGTCLSAVRLDGGKQNEFNDCEFSTTDMSIAAVEINDSQLNYFNNCRFSGEKTTLPAIINKGYQTHITQCYFENYDETEIYVGNRTIFLNNSSNKTSKYPIVVNLTGDAASNIIMCSAPIYVGSNYNVTDSKISEFYFDDQNRIYFQGKTKLQQILTGKNFTYKTISPTGTSHNCTSVLNQGSWLINVTFMTSDSNNTLSSTLISRFKTATLSENTLASILKIQSDVTTGTMISNLHATLDTNGDLNISCSTTSSVELIIYINAVCQNEY